MYGNTNGPKKQTILGLQVEGINSGNYLCG
jgi:hypothetical protein